MSHDPFPRSRPNAVNAGWPLLVCRRKSNGVQSVREQRGSDFTSFPLAPNALRLGGIRQGWLGVAVSNRCLRAGLIRHFRWINRPWIGGSWAWKSGDWQEDGAEKINLGVDALRADPARMARARGDGDN